MRGFDGVAERVEDDPRWGAEAFFPRCLRCKWEASWPHVGEGHAVMSVRKHLERAHKISDPDIAVVRRIETGGST